MNKILGIIAGLMFFIGAASLTLTLYLWIGDWPQQIKQIIDHERSRAATEHRPPPPLIQNLDSRESLSLDGTWKALIDPNESLLGRMFGNIARNNRPQSPSELIEFSFDDGVELEVPGDWNTQDPRLVFYKGGVWYKRTFDYTPKPGRRSFLYFGAANYEASVYLNGIRVGRHVGGFTAFNYEVTDNLREGENLLVVLVDNRHEKEDIPTPTTDWTNYGGLTRSVRLVDLPETFVQSYHVQLAKGAKGRLAGWVQLDGPAKRQTLKLSIPELGIDTSLEADALGRAEFELPAKPDLWSPESPKLYSVVIESEDDRVEDQIGFRTIEVSGTRILLNGEPIFLRGISLHEEAGFGRGRAHSREDAGLLLGWARELECNFVRLSHYPHNEAMVRAADRLGFLVWSEIPVYWNVDFGNPYTLALGRQQLSEMIERDRNRASVIFWSIGNETPISDERNDFMRALADHARELDGTRLISGAIVAGMELIGPMMARSVLPTAIGFGPEEWAMELDTDPLAEILDVPALNQYWGWYYSGALAAFTPFSAREMRQVVIDNLHRIRIRTSFEKPLVISEFGAGARKGMRADEEDLAVFSEDYQALVYRKQLEMLSKQDNVRGMSPWILKDFRSTMRLYQGVQDYWNLKGLVSDEGEKKLAFAVVRDHYLERKSGN